MATNSQFGNELDITGDNIVLSGFDFSLEGGWQVDADGNNDTIENSYFLVQTTAQYPVAFWGVGGNFIYNIMNGNNGSSDKYDSGFMLRIFGNGGAFNVEYNEFLNANGQGIVGDGDGGPVESFNMEYNLLVNPGGNSTTGTHGDYVFVSGSETSIVEDYNTIYETQAPLGGGTIGLWDGNNEFTPTDGTVDVSYNTMVFTYVNLAGTNTEEINPVIWVEPGETTGLITITNNYVDPSGILGVNGVPGVWLEVGSDNTAQPLTTPGPVTISQNVNMVTGNGNLLVTGVPVIISDTVSGNTVTLTGTDEGATTITVYDGTTKLGTTSTGGSSSTGSVPWTFTTGALTNGAHTLTVTSVMSPAVTGSTGFNTASSSVKVTVNTGS